MSTLARTLARRAVLVTVMSAVILPAYGQTDGDGICDPEWPDNDCKAPIPVDPTQPPATQTAPRNETTPTGIPPGDVEFPPEESTTTTTEPLTTTTLEDSGVRFSQISQEVKVFNENDPDGISFGRPGRPLMVGDHVVTGEESEAILVLPDGSTFRVAPNSEIEIVALKKTTTNWQLIKGKILTNLKHIMNNEPIEVRTTPAVTGIKGTEFVLETTENTTTLKVFEGVVAFTSTVTDETATVTAGQTMTADGDGLSELAEFDVGAEKAAWNLPVDESSRGRPVALLVSVPLLFATLGLASAWGIRRHRSARAVLADTESLFPGPWVPLPNQPPPPPPPPPSS